MNAGCSFIHHNVAWYRHIFRLKCLTWKLRKDIYIVNKIICKNKSYWLINSVSCRTGKLDPFTFVKFANRWILYPYTILMRNKIFLHFVQFTKIMITLLHRMIILKDFAMHQGWLIGVLHVNKLPNYSFPVPWFCCTD